MTAKIEIEIDEPLLQKAEAWAERRGISLSSAVTAYLQELTREELPQPKSDWLKGLAGIARTTASAPGTLDTSTEYVEYLERRYCGYRGCGPPGVRS